MSKKLLYMLLAGSLSMSVLAACGETSDDPAPTEDPLIEEPADVPAN